MSGLTRFCSAKGLLVLAILACVSAVIVLAWRREIGFAFALAFLSTLDIAMLLVVVGVPDHE